MKYLENCEVSAKTIAKHVLLDLCVEKVMYYFPLFPKLSFRIYLSSPLSSLDYLFSAFSHLLSLTFALHMMHCHSSFH